MISISIQHQAPAFLDESYPIAIEVTNTDDKDLEVIFDVLLQPTDVDSASELSIRMIDSRIAILNIVQIIRLSSMASNFRVSSKVFTVVLSSPV